jgi:hypothetical protein
MQDHSFFGQRFVWTKFGVESGQPILDIIARKEIERRTNGGTFLWGIGNNIGQSIRALMKLARPEVIFSPIASPPRLCDETPEQVFAWTKAETIDGRPYAIPAGSVVLSRGGNNKRVHFALVCHSHEPLQPKETAPVLYAKSLRNLVSGRQVGSSQVTSVVEATLPHQSGRGYPVAMQLRLAEPYFVRLHTPIPVPCRVRNGLSTPAGREKALRGLRNAMVTHAKN